MKICSVCNEIVSANQRCALSNCPNKGSARPAPKSRKVIPGPTGRSDRTVQAGLDRAGDVARNATRRAAFAITVIFAVVAAIAAIGFNLAGDNRNMQNEATSDPEASTPNGSLPNATARQTSNFEDVNNNALIIGKRWVSSSDDADWEKFDGIFSSLSTYEQKGVPFCHLEVTAYVSYSVPCGYEEQYRYVFTGGSFGSSE